MANKFPEIKEKNQGKFTKWVKQNMPGKDNCEAADAVMAKKDDFSEAVVKMANYAKNFGCKSKGGPKQKSDGGDDKKENVLTKKQKTLPESLQKKIIASKNKK
tara:strand:- start:543 stop:851 length:309 start_codon:yes stop_codon:yes gene_type:complete